jgi:hypothetical protein
LNNFIGDIRSRPLFGLRAAPGLPGNLGTKLRCPFAPAIVTRLPYNFLHDSTPAFKRLK